MDWRKMKDCQITRQSRLIEDFDLNPRDRSLHAVCEYLHTDFNKVGNLCEENDILVFTMPH